MMYWVIYDISQNKARSKVAKTCKNYGLARVQKSTFLGELTRNKVEMLALEVEEIIDKDGDDKVFVAPASEEEFAKKIIFGKLDESVAERPGVIFID